MMRLFEVGQHRVQCLYHPVGGQVREKKEEALPLVHQLLFCGHIHLTWCHSVLPWYENSVLFGLQSVPNTYDSPGMLWFFNSRLDMPCTQPNGLSSYAILRDLSCETLMHGILSRNCVSQANKYFNMCLFYQLNSCREKHKYYSLIVFCIYLRHQPAPLL